MKNFDTPLHSRGLSLFLDDLTVPAGLLHAALFFSPAAHGKIKKLDIEAAKNSPGVAALFTWRDIPGENQVGGIIRDEPLLAENEVHYMGQPLVLVAADTKAAALRAVKQVELEITPLPVLTDPREACEKGSLIAPPRTFCLGDVSTAWEKCRVVVAGRVDSGGQEHFYMEPQASLAVPTERGGIKIFSSTQSPSGVQRSVSKILRLPMHLVEVDVTRLGGAFGGKEDQATPWAALAALAAYRLKKPVKLTLTRREDMTVTGKRHPYSSDFKIGLDGQGKILAYEVTLYQNAGAAADLSTAILERSMFHVTNSYAIPNVKATAFSCRTHLPPFTAFRGFGAPQAMFVIEAAIHKAAEKSGISAAKIQETNLLQENDTFPYGAQVENCRAGLCFAAARERYDFDTIFRQVEEYNAAHNTIKKGAALMPVCFGISFTNTMLNQAGALVHVYTDGSVSVSTGAVEMGQGVNNKILQVAALTFSIAPGRVKIETTNTTRTANTSPTAASTGADMNGKAAQIACREILERLKKVAAELLPHSAARDILIKDEQVLCRGATTGLTWQELIAKAYERRSNLSAQGYYATPRIFFDRDKEKGKPFAYHVFGTAITEVSLDCIRGRYEIDRVCMVHDAGKNIDLLIDRGQVEGALLQGIGWLTIEELLYTKEGRLLSNSAGTYKYPDIKFTPKEVQLHFLENADNPYAVLQSKAIGEPPFMYGIGCYFALMNAIKAYRPGKDFPIHAPLTPEKVLHLLYES